MVTATAQGGLVGLSMEVEGEELISRQLSRFGEGVKDFSPAWRKMIEELYHIERDQFESQGGHSGGWAGLAESTSRRKGHEVIMVNTRRLFRSLTQSGGDNVADVTPNQLTFGSRVFYGVYHQSPAARTRLPRRPLIAFTNDDRTALVKILQAYLVDIAKAQEGISKSAGIFPR